MTSLANVVKAAFISLCVTACGALFPIATDAADKKILAEAQAAFDVGDYKKVVKLLDKQNDAPSQSLLGRVFYETDLSDGLQYITNAAILAPNDPVAGAWKAWVECRRKHKEEAHQRFALAIAQGPNNAVVHALHGVYLVRIGRPEQAGPDIAKALSLAPNDFVVCELCADYYAAQLEPDKALEVMSRVLKNYPKNPLGYMRMAELYETTGNIYKAKEYYTKAVQVAPNFSYGHFRRANFFLVRKNWVPAVADCTAALDTCFSDALSLKVRRLRATCYLKLANYAKSIPDLDIALANVSRWGSDIDGSSQRDLLARADANEHLGNYAKALEDVNFLMSRKKNSTEGIVFRARLNTEAGNYKVALKDYNYLVGLDDGVPEWYRSRADLFKKMGRNEDAASDIRMAEKLEARL